MKKIKKNIITKFNALNEFENWDLFVDKTYNGTIFHKKIFLEYHQHKYDYKILSFYNNQNKLLAGLIFINKNNNLISPYGASYGGIIFTPMPIASMNEIVVELISWSRQNQINAINITTAPIVYNDSLIQDADFLYLYNGFKLSGVKFSSVIDLKLFGDNIVESYSNMGKRAIKKSIKSKLYLKMNSDLDKYYKILSINKKKFNVRPAHKLNELKYLIEKNPNKINLFEIYYEKNLIAGIITFHCNKKTLLTFYIASDPEYHLHRPVNRCLHEVVLYAIKEGYDFIDLGVSMNTDNDNPMEPAWSLISFKEFTGARGFLRNSYRLNFGQK